MDSELRQAVETAKTRADVRAAVHGIYAELQTQIDQRRPRCELSGRCCRFDEFGHRLYVTTIELAAFVQELRQAPTNTDPGGCPFQVGKLCGVHAIRPFGCRIFFCDETSTDWQRQQYEQFHAELKRLHEELGVPYFYVEWRQAMRILDCSQANPGFDTCKTTVIDSGPSEIYTRAEVSGS